LQGANGGRIHTADRADRLGETKGIAQNEIGEHQDHGRFDDVPDHRESSNHPAGSHGRNSPRSASGRSRSRTMRMDRSPRMQSVQAYRRSNCSTAQIDAANAMDAANHAGSPGTFIRSASFPSASD